MSFFSGFTSSIELGRLYQTTNSEAIATTSNICLSISSIASCFGGNGKKASVVCVIFFIISIVVLVVYYVNKNEIIKVYKENADENLNKIYFTSSIVSAVLFIIIINFI